MNGRDLLLQRLVRDRIEEADDCEILGFSGEGRCIEIAVAIRWEDGHPDLVCEEHANRAEQRGAVVVYPFKESA